MSKSSEDLLEELAEENIHEELRRKIQRTATIMLKQEYENILDEAEGIFKSIWSHINRITFLKPTPSSPASNPH
jgi:hypothetical protein